MLWKRLEKYGSDFSGDTDYHDMVGTESSHEMTNETVAVV